MWAFDYRFFPNQKRISISDFMDQHCWPLIGELIKCGQVGDSGDLVIQGSIVKYLGACPEKVSLSPRFHSKWAARSYARVLKHSLRPPSWKILGCLVHAGANCTCARRSDLILSENFLSIASPITCGKCGLHVPLYRLRSLTMDEQLGVQLWNQAYRHSDALFIGSGVGERFGYQQTASFSSPLSQDGCKVCRQLELRLKVPVYYYLNKYYGVSEKAERKRRCPRCRANWLLSKPWLNRYHFKCKRCRLISNIAWDV